jgi:hypothetical protein
VAWRGSKSLRLPALRLPSFCEGSFVSLAFVSFDMTRMLKRIAGTARHCERQRSNPES